MPDDVAPDDVAPDDVAPEDVAPDDVAPDDVAPDDVGLRAALIIATSPDPTPDVDPWRSYVTCRGVT